MSVVAGVVRDGSVWMGGDSLYSGSGRGYPIPKLPKVWEQGPYLVGVCGAGSCVQAVSGVSFPDLPDLPDLRDLPDIRLREHLISDVVPLLRVHCLEAHIRDQTEELPMGPKGSVLLGVRGQMFFVSADLVVIPVEDCAIGSGQQEAYGALYVARELGLGGREALELALQASARHVLDVGGPFSILEAPASRSMLAPA